MSVQPNQYLKLCLSSAEAVSDPEPLTEKSGLLTSQSKQSAIMMEEYDVFDESLLEPSSSPLIWKVVGINPSWPPNPNEL